MENRAVFCWTRNRKNEKFRSSSKGERPEEEQAEGEGLEQEGTTSPRRGVFLTKEILMLFSHNPDSHKMLILNPGVER